MKLNSTTIIKKKTTNDDGYKLVLLNSSYDSL
jgi:hypothetical protein